MDLVKSDRGHHLIRFRDRQNLRRLKMHLDKTGEKAHLLPMDNRASRRKTPLSKDIEGDGKWYAVVIA